MTIPNPPAGIPPGSLYWKVTNPDGSIAQDGWATPIASGGGAGFGAASEPEPTAEDPKQEGNDNG